MLEKEGYEIPEDESDNMEDSQIDLFAGDEPVHRVSMFFDMAAINTSIWTVKEFTDILLETMASFNDEMGIPVMFDAAASTDSDDSFDIDIYTEEMLSDKAIDKFCGQLLKGLGVFVPIRYHRYFISTTHLGQGEFELSDYVEYKRNLKT